MKIVRRRILDGMKQDRLDIQTFSEEDGYLDGKVIGLKVSNGEEEVLAYIDKNDHVGYISLVSLVYKDKEIKPEMTIDAVEEVIKELLL